MEARSGSKAKEKERAAPSVSCCRRGRRMPGETVLVVEDNPLNLELAAEVLAAAGYVVLQAVDAEEGIALARAKKPSLILMDLSLPGIDGLDATGILKADVETRSIPVVAL